VLVGQPQIDMEVEITEAQSEFHIHKGILTHYRSYFRAAVKEECGAGGIITLPEDDPKVFEIVFHAITTAFIVLRELSVL
jgi:hypothetical protein